MAVHGGAERLLQVRREPGEKKKKDDGFAQIISNRRRSYAGQREIRSDACGIWRLSILLLWRGLSDRDDRLRFVFRNFPLTEIHPEAFDAAIVAEFAGTHGQFWLAHDVLFENPCARCDRVIAGILEFIPIAGWMMAATTIATFGALTYAHWIWMLALLGVWRVCMDYGISPRVMGRQLEIHPLLAIFTVMVGGAVGGIVGVYISIPLVAIFRVFWRRLSASREPYPTQTTVREPRP